MAVECAGCGAGGRVSGGKTVTFLSTASDAAPSEPPMDRVGRVGRRCVQCGLQDSVAIYFAQTLTFPALRNKQSDTLS